MQVIFYFLELSMNVWLLWNKGDYLLSAKQNFTDSFPYFVIIDTCINSCAWKAKEVEICGTNFYSGIWSVIHNNWISALGLRMESVLDVHAPNSLIGCGLGHYFNIGIALNHCFFLYLELAGDRYWSRDHTNNPTVRFLHSSKHSIMIVRQWNVKSLASLAFRRPICWS